MIKTGDLFADKAATSDEETIAVLADTPGVRIEKILSTGQASPAGFGYDQDFTEWIFLLSGSAGLLIEGEAAPRALRPGAYLEIPARRRHRVEWTDAEQQTIWLAVHVKQ